MLSLVPFNRVNPATGEVSPDIDEKKVFSTVVVFVHPSQKLSSIEEAVDMLLVVSQDPKSVPAMFSPLSPASAKCGGVLPLPNEWRCPGIAFQYGSRQSNTASQHTNPWL